MGSQQCGVDQRLIAPLLIITIGVYSLLCRVVAEKAGRRTVLMWWVVRHMPNRPVSLVPRRWHVITEERDEREDAIAAVPWSQSG